MLQGRPRQLLSPLPSIINVSPSILGLSSSIPLNPCLSRCMFLILTFPIFCSIVRLHICRCGSKIINRRPLLGCERPRVSTTLAHARSAYLIETVWTPKISDWIRAGLWEVDMIEVGCEDFESRIRQFCYDTEIVRPLVEWSGALNRSSEIYISALRRHHGLDTLV